MIDVGALLGSAWLKPVAGLVIGCAALAAVGWGVSAIYAAGESAAEARAQVRIDAAEKEADRLRIDYEARLEQAQRTIDELSLESARRTQEQAQRAAQAELATREALNANPDFARTVRPVDLRRVRDADFARLAEAAERGAAVSRRITEGMPAPGTGAGEQPE